jgi:hypothetical protein
VGKWQENEPAKAKKINIREQEKELVRPLRSMFIEHYKIFKITRPI